MIRLALTLALAVAVAVPVAACGRKGTPKPPSQTEQPEQKPAS
jgi:hypothetical protein